MAEHTTTGQKVCALLKTWYCPSGFVLVFIILLNPHFQFWIGMCNKTTGAFTSGGYQDHQQEKDGAHEHAWKDQTGNPDLAVLNPVDWICGKRKMFTWILGIALWFPGFWSILMWSDYMSCLTRPVIFSWLGAKKQRHWAETTGEKFRI